MGKAKTQDRSLLLLQLKEIEFTQGEVLRSPEFAPSRISRSSGRSFPSSIGGQRCPRKTPRSDCGSFHACSLMLMESILVSSGSHAQQHGALTPGALTQGRFAKKKKKKKKKKEGVQTRDFFFFFFFF